MLEGRLLRRLRKEAGKRQVDVQAECGVWANHVSVIELGTVRPTVEIIGKMLRLYGYDVCAVKRTDNSVLIYNLLSDDMEDSDEDN